MKRMIVVVALMTAACFGAAFAQAPTEEKAKKLYVVGTSHLDTQWRWTIQNSINEYIPSTFRDNFKLLELFPKYVFSFEGAFRYSLFKEYFPEEYAKVKPYIEAGRWRVTGSWWDAVDVNVPSFESLVRQTLYGNGYFKREFGKTSRDIFLPDCFGFGYALPSIARHCGLESFSTQKLTWGSAYGVPFDIGKWQGVDGSTIFAGIRPGDYVAKIGGDLSRDTLWDGRITRQGDSTGLYGAYMYFGTGDIGGAPESLSVAWLQKSVESDGPIEVKSVGADDLIGLANSCDTSRLPRYNGEFLMTRHGVGCYTSQAAMKRWNRKNEQLGDAAERASVIAYLVAGLPYPREELRDTWQRFLWHQFHDDLTGTSIPQAYEFSWSDEVLCQNRFAQILENAVAATAVQLVTQVKGTPLVLFNPLSIDRADVVEATIAFPEGAPKSVKVFTDRKSEVPSQVVTRWPESLKVVFQSIVPSVGYAVYDVQGSKKPSALPTNVKATDRTLENERYVVTLNDDGDVSSLFDKNLKKELLTAPIQFQLLRDKPKRWPAWEIDYEDIIAPPRAFVGGPAQIRVLESGPARVALEVMRKTDKSSFRTVISLVSGGNIVQLDNEVDWYEPETLLKVAFTLACANDSVTYDLGLGTIKRGLNHEKLYEVPGHQWADMTAQDGSYGVAVLNDCKYGWDHPDAGTLRLTLIHTPGVYDSWSWVGDQSSQDVGHHEFSFAIQSHSGDWQRGGAALEAVKLNQPVSVWQTDRHAGTLGRLFSLFQLPMITEKSVRTPDGQSPFSKSYEYGVLVEAGNLIMNIPADRRPGLDISYMTPQFMLTAMKLSENTDDVIIRLRNLVLAPADSVPIRFGRTISSATEVNGQEESKGTAHFSDTILKVAVGPYQPKSYAVRMVETAHVPVEIISQSVSLPFDLDGISTDADRRDGNFDGHGNSISGDLLPDTLIHLNIPYVFGPKVSGAKNVVSCTGQKITLPLGGYQELCVLAASVGGPAEGTFVIGKDSVRVWVQDWAEPIGQWNNRLVAGNLVTEPEQIAPGYINRQPVAWYGSHRHTAAGENEAYRFSYLYLLTFDLPPATKSITLPNNPRIKVLAATVAKKPYEDVRAATPLYDVTNSTLARIVVDSTSFLGQATITMSSPVPGSVVHYTLDGSDPTAESPVYVEPIRVNATTAIKARAIKDGADDHHVASVTVHQLTARGSSTLVSPAYGLNCSYYEGEWSKLPNFDSLTAVREVVMPVVAIPPFARKELYGLVFTGYINIPKDGVYEFAISSDDGSHLIIGDTLLIDNDGLHGAGDVTGLIALKAGPHKFAVRMFQAKGDQDLAVSITGPGLQKQKLNKEMLWHGGKPTRK
ncbi:MAG: glycoside hydrolase family 38 C-terminal domain-containing protein [Candidatus Zixiibacteriota bacterium]